MLKIDKSRKSDKVLYNSSSQDYIPIACHYDENTLITKNGELLQIIQINGINSERVSSKLSSLRETVRNAIRNNINSDNFAIWIHTIRCKTNLDDPKLYNKILPANIHDLWRQKNFWNDKFVNTLYISIVYDSAEVKVKNISAIINSLFVNVIQSFQDQYFTIVHKRLCTVVDKILADLQEYGATKLGMRFENNTYYSDPILLYRRIIHLNEDDCKVPTADISEFLATHKYLVGSDKIEIIENDRKAKRFAAILSIKEYQDVSAAALDKFMQLPIELITTEVFYFVDRKEVVSAFSEQNYILKVSGDEALRDIQGISYINSKDPDIRFCRQQISIAVIGSDVDKIDTDIKRAAVELGKVGIVCVREDINLEQTFWSKLPGNFNYLRRASPTTLKDTAALASLHNFPIGDKSSVWGKAVTLLRTEKGTPYFLNFHTKNNKTINCIYGTSKSGKTLLANFLISEATKFNPTIMHIAENNNSKIFISAIEGRWIEYEPAQNFINPLLCDDNIDSRKFIEQFLKIVCNHYIVPLKSDELEFVVNIVDIIFQIEIQNRNISYLLKTLDFKTVGGKEVKARLAVFQKGGMYQGIFDNQTAFNLKEHEVVGFNIYKLSDKYFSDTYYPEDKKLLDQFEQDLALNSSIRLGTVHALRYFLNLTGAGPKLLAIDDMNTVLNLQYFDETTSEIFQELSKNNGVLIGTINLNLLQQAQENVWHKWLDLADIRIMLSSDVKLTYLKKMLNIDTAEHNKLLSLVPLSRRFLIKYDEQSIIAELSIGVMVSIVKILSAGSVEINIFDRIRSEHPKLESWLEQLYQAFNTEY